MKRSIYFRLFVVVLVASMSILLFSYVRARTAKTDEPCNDSGIRGARGRRPRQRGRVSVAAACE